MVCDHGQSHTASKTTLKCVCKTVENPSNLCLLNPFQTVYLVCSLFLLIFPPASVKAEILWEEWATLSSVLLNIVLARVAWAVLFACISTAYNALQEEAGIAAGHVP